MALVSPVILGKWPQAAGLDLHCGLSWAPPGPAQGAATFRSLCSPWPGAEHRQWLTFARKSQNQQFLRTASDQAKDPPNHLQEQHTQGQTQRHQSPAGASPAPWGWPLHSKSSMVFGGCGQSSQKAKPPKLYKGLTTELYTQN